MEQLVNDIPAADLYDPEAIAWTHPAINHALMRQAELAAEDGTERTFGDAIGQLGTYLTTMSDWMQAARSAFHQEWRAAENEYKMKWSRAKDKNRSASIFPLDPDDEGGDEYFRERAGAPMPNGFEIIEQTVPRFYEAMFGTDPDKYVTIIGRQANDATRAEKVQEYLNYQQGCEIDTPAVGHAWIRDGGVYGAGILAQLWDCVSRTRKNINVSNWDMWFDPSSESVDECRFIMWRRFVTVGELQKLREAQAVNFTDKALREVIINDSDTDRDDINLPTAEQGDTPLDIHRQVTLYLFMEKDRWVYWVNKKMVVAVVKNPVPPITHTDGTTQKQSYPVHLFVPLPALNSKDDFRGVYGMSILTLSKGLLDLYSSVVFLMMSNLERQALGVTFIDPTASPEAFNQRHGMELNAGMGYPCKEAGRNVFQLQFPNILPTCLNATSFLDGRLERAHGINNAVRGVASYATETATAKQQDLDQAGYRMKMGILLALGTMRHYWDIALRLVKANLESAEYIKVTGENQVWDTIDKSDFEGVYGKDLIPTGVPLSSSQAFLAQQGLNLVTILQQLKTNGMQDLDARKILRDMLTVMGYRAVDEVVPKEHGMGSDPKQENIAMLQGESVEVGPHDLHDNHLISHMADCFYEPGGRQIMKSDQRIAETVMAHCMAHAEALDGTDSQAAQQFNGLVGAGGNAEGRGSGTGLPGQNTQPLAPRPKPQHELEAQVG